MTPVADMTLDEIVGMTLVMADKVPADVECRLVDETFADLKSHMANCIYKELTHEEICKTFKLMYGIKIVDWFGGKA